MPNGIRAANRGPSAAVVAPRPGAIGARVSSQVLAQRIDDAWVELRAGVSLELGQRRLG